MGESIKAIITGAAGFIGFHVAEKLLSQGCSVVGHDALTDYYDPALKTARLKRLERYPNFEFVKGRLEDSDAIAQLFIKHRPELAIHLGAQAGVRFSIEAPAAYFESNLAGVFSVLEAARQTPPNHLLLASTSSVYGANLAQPFRETDAIRSPVSFYAATKSAMESMAHSYSHLYDIRTTALRFFTVYGPWGRPDMALFKFTAAMLRGEAIDVYGMGQMRRDFTYISDLVEAIRAVSEEVPEAGVFRSPSDSLSPVAPFRVVNIGGGSPVELMEFIRAVERAVGVDAKLNMLPMQDGDVVSTSADTALLRDLVGEAPKTALDIGVQKFVQWYRAYYAK